MTPRQTRSPLIANTPPGAFDHDQLVSESYRNRNRDRAMTVTVDHDSDSVTQLPARDREVNGHSRRVVSCCLSLQPFLWSRRTAV